MADVLQPARDASEVITTLMVRFSDGDRTAIKPLFNLAWPIVLRYCRRSLSNIRDAEDAAQESMVKMFSRIADFDRDRNGLAWILGIAGFEVKTIRKRTVRRREESVGALVRMTALDPGAEEETANREARELLARAIDTLSPQDRQIVEDILADPIGEVGPPADVRSRKRKQRAIDRLRLAWRRFHAG